MATTDHTDCTIALAAGGAVVPVRVTHECSGHSARRPPTPISMRIAAAVHVLSPTPAVEWSTGSSPVMLCKP